MADFEFGGQVDASPNARSLGSLDDWALVPDGTLVDRHPLEDGGSRLVVDPESFDFDVCVADGAIESTPVLRCSVFGTWNDVSVLWWGPTVDGRIEVLREGDSLYDWGDVTAAIETPTARDWLVEDRLVELGNRPATWPAVLGADSGIFTDFAAPVDDPAPYQLLLDTGDDQFTADCGSASITTEIPLPVCVVGESNGFPTFEAVYETEGAGPDASGLRRDGEPVDLGPPGSQPLIDPTAEPGRSYDYDLLVVGPQSVEPVLVPCGSAQRSAVESDDDALAQAAERYESLVVRPYLYMSFTVDGVSYEGTGGPAASRFRAEPALPDGVVFDLATVHGDLALAIAQGQDVAYELDPFSGVPTSFVLDERQWTITCVEYDTAPPELRTGPCGGLNNIIDP